MEPYFLLLSVPSLFALFYRKNFDIKIVFIIFLIFVLFVGLRYEVGPDWFGYEYTHKSLDGKNLSDIFPRSEPLSYLLFWMSQNFGSEMLLSNVVSAFLLMLGVFSFAYRTINPGLAILAATPYLIIVFGMSGIRQAMGVGVFLYVLSHWQKSDIIFRGVGIIIASLFHTSALFCGLFVIYTLQINIWIKIVAALLLGFIVFYLIQGDSIYSGSFEKYERLYIEGTDTISTGAIFHIGLIVIPAMLGYIFKSKIKNLVPNHDLLMIGIFGALGLLALNTVSTTVASRLTLYFYFVPMMVYPALTLAFGKKNRNFIMTIIILAHFAILTVWMLLGNHSIHYVPYRNLLFQTD